MELWEQLITCDLFCTLTKKDIEQYVIPNGKIQSFTKGQFLIIPHQQVDRIGVLLSGKVHLMHMFSSGNFSLMGVLPASGVLGADLACTHSRISPYHAMASDDCTVFSFRADVVLQLGGMPEAVRLSCLDRMLTLIAKENMKKEYRLAILAQKGLRERIITYLSMQANKRGSRTIVIPFSREELASFLCVNRAALSHELSLMQQEGLITFRKNIFTICGDMSFVTP